jgi:protocatechuate 3,4-dioxygenase alpha subunit
MPQPLPGLTETPSQTAGPYVHIGCTPGFAGIAGVYPQDPGIAPFPDDAPGERITITGTVKDGLGAALRDVLLESWQADAEGRFGPGSRGWARLPADQGSGLWTLQTVRPGAAGDQAPHVALWIVARGINIGLQTRLYFPDDDHARDPVLARIDPARRQTLLATPDGPGHWRFDIHLQGDHETVFLDL